MHRSATQTVKNIYLMAPRKDLQTGFMKVMNGFDAEALRFGNCLPLSEDPGKVLQIHNIGFILEGRTQACSVPPETALVDGS